MFALIIILLSGVMLYTGQMNTSYGNGNGFGRVLRLFLLMYIVYTLFAYAIKENKEKTFWGFLYLKYLRRTCAGDYSRGGCLCGYIADFQKRNILLADWCIKR